MNIAASKGLGRLWADVYSVAPAGIFVPFNSPVKRPEDLAGIPISVGYQSGSHYSSIQALEQYLTADKINLSFAEGMLFKRLDNLLEGKSQASALFSGPYYLAEQLGYRKIIDTTFMIASMITGTPDEEDLKKFFRALKRAQRDIDLRPDLYTRYYKNEFPTRYHDIMDTRRWGPGERIVFEPYTEEAFLQSRDWIAEREIFEGGKPSMGSDSYKERGRPAGLMYYQASRAASSRPQRADRNELRSSVRRRSQRAVLTPGVRREVPLSRRPSSCRKNRSSISAYT